MAASLRSLPSPEPAVLAEVTRQGLEDVVFYAIHDPESVRAAIAAGVGAEVTLDVTLAAPK